MAHLIGKYLGQDTIAYSGDPLWHRLGDLILPEERQNIPAVLKRAHLDWDVEKVPLYHAYLSALQNRIVQNPYAYGVIRPSDGAILASVGLDTELVQNHEACAILEPLIKDFGFTIEVAGALRGGQSIWMLVKAPEGFESAPGDKHDVYMLLRHHHTNGGSTEGILTETRVVCNNTMQMALGNVGGDNVDTGRAFRIRKTSGVRDRIEEAKKLMSALGSTIERTKQTYQELARLKLTPEQTAQFIAGILPLPTEQKKDENGVTVRNDLGQVVMVEKESKVITERRKKITNLIFTQPGAELTGANLDNGDFTGWSVINAISRYYDHVRVEEAKNDSAKQKATISAAFGDNAATKLLALARMRKLQQSLVVAG